MKKPFPSLPWQPSWQQFCAHGLAYKLNFQKRRDAIVLQLGKCICCQSHGPINFWKQGEIFPFKATIPFLFTFLDIYHSPLCCCLVTKSCLSFCKPMDYSSPVSSFQGISQARILEWVAISFSKASSRPRDRTQVSCIGRRIFLSLSHKGSPYSPLCIASIYGKDKRVET